MLFNLPKKDDPLQLDQFFTEVRNLLDECYQQMIAGLTDGEIPILMPLMHDFTASGRLGLLLKRLEPKTRTLREIETITNAPDQQHLRMFVNDSTLIHIQYLNVNNKYLLMYSISHWLWDFTFDPNRSQSLYSTFLVIRVCHQVIEAFIAKNGDFCRADRFFMQYDELGDSNASRLLEHAKNGSDSNDLLLFLQYLSKIHWLNIYTRGWQERCLAHAILQWVCKTLIS